MIEEVISLKDKVTEPAEKMRKEVTHLSEAMKPLKEISERISGMGGPVGELTEKLSGLGSSASGLGGELGEVAESLGAVGGPIAIAVVAVAALATGFGILAEKAMELSLEAAEMKEKLLATFSALGGGEEAGKATLGMLNDLSASLPQSRAQLGEWTKQFQAMGVTDLGALRGQITATASAQAIMGDEGATAYTTLSRRIQEAAEAHSGLKIAERQLASLAQMGVNVSDVARKMGVSTQTLTAQLKAGTVDAGKFGVALQDALIEKGKGPLEAMAGSLDSLKAKFKDNIGRMFEDVDVKPLTDALRGFFDIFSQAQPSGQAMKSGLMPVMNKLFQIAGKLVLSIKHLALDVVIFGLKAYIALKPIIRWVSDLFERFHVLHGMLLLMKGVFVVLAVAAALVIAPFALLVAAGIAVWTMLVGLVGAIADFVPKAFAKLKEWAKSGATFAWQFIQGLVDGITGGIKRAVAAVSNLGTEIKDGIKGVLGIHSPSRVMFELGGHVAGGFATGISAGAGAVGQSAAFMGSAVNDNMMAPGMYSPPAPQMRAVAGGSSSSTQVTVEKGAIVIQGAGKGAEQLTEEAVSLIFERVALAQGA